MDEVLLAKQAISKAFPGITESEADNLVDVGRIKTYSPETCLCVEGRFEDIFYVILAGEVLVTDWGDFGTGTLMFSNNLGV